MKCKVFDVENGNRKTNFFLVKEKDMSKVIAEDYFSDSYIIATTVVIPYNVEAIHVKEIESANVVEWDVYLIQNGTITNIYSDYGCFNDEEFNYDSSKNAFDTFVSKYYDGKYVKVC